MPTYDYRCENGHSFEEFQSMLAAPIKICPICGGKAERLISGGTGLIFKGSGFYITDYPKKSDGKPEKKAAKEKAAESEASVSKAAETGGKTAATDSTAKREG